jgi:SpoVK/Ycf46/Vps4 family AAA+-type ATPase
MEQFSVIIFQTQLANFLKARFPFLYISTWEEDRVLSVINAVAQKESLIKTPREVFNWSLTRGLYSDVEQGKDETKSPLKALEFIEKYDKPSIFVLKDFHIYFGGQGRTPDFQVIRKIRDIIPVVKQSQKPKNVIFLSSSLVLPNDLQKDVSIIDFDLPTFKEIHDLLKEMIASNIKVSINVTPDESERLAKAALGLTIQEAENAFALAMVEDGKLDINDIETILEEKRQIIKKTEILEFIKSDLSMDDVGGLENLKRWLRKRDKSWLDSAKRYCIPPPKGVLITGVPGCGKSLTAKAISAMWQLPLLRLDIGKIFSGIVGSSEENMRKSIKTAEAISPCILWIDEIEKGFSGTGSTGDSGTSTRIFGTFLTWMQEKTNPVFVIATANNIHLLPSEFLRKGRFDEIFFVDLPTQKERMEIFKVHLKRRLKDPFVLGKFKVTEEIITTLADLTEGFIGAEIEQIVISALFEAFSEERCIVFTDFEKVIKNTVPLSITQAEQIRSLREWANVRAVAATPKEHRVQYIEKPEQTDDDIRTARGGRTVDF